ncbi:MAG: MG2 domain-containing protein [Sandaracinus sp.]
MDSSSTRPARFAAFVLRGGAAALGLAMGSCGHGPEPTTGGVFGDASYADVVVDLSRRPEWRPLRAAPTAVEEAEPDAALGDTGPRAFELGEVDILIGTEGDRRELPADAIDRLDAGFQGSYVRAGDTTAPERLHVVLDAPYQSWADEGTFVHLVVLRPDFRPAAGAEIYLFGRLLGTADEHGAFAFRRHPQGLDGGFGVIVARHEGLARRVRYDAGSRTSSFEAVTIYGYTDRGIYEPGDTALFRAVAWRLRGEYVPYAAHDLEVQLVDDTERIVSGANVRTDEWGVAERPLPIPSTLADGPYRLRVRSGEEVAESRLVVQRFVAPVIAIDHDLPRYLARTREELTTNVSLRYFAGGDIGATHLALVAKHGEQELARVERDVSGPGPHQLVFDAPTLTRIIEALGGRSTSTRRTLALDLSATDENQRTDTIHRFVDVVPNPYEVAVELDRTRYQVGDPVHVMVRSAERDGVPVRDRDVVLQVGSGLRLTARSDADGVANFTFPMLTSGARIAAYLDDVREPVGEAELPPPVSIPMLSAVPSTVVASGEEIDVHVLFPSDVRPVEGVVHADVVDSSGAIIHSSLVPIVERGGRPEAQSRVVAPSWGSMLLTLWCVARRGSAVGVVTDGQSLVVTPGETLTVTLDGLPERAGPGDEIDARIEVRDRSGALHEAMLGVSVADRSVLSLLDPFERGPVDRFYNPERKVLASTGAQTLTWPWVSRTWGEDRMDIGWPGTFGFHAGRDPEPGRLNPGEEAHFDAMPGSAYGTDPMSALGALMGDQIGGNFGFGGLGLVGTGYGGGGTGEGTIGLGNLGTIGYGAGTGSGSGYGSGAGGFRGRGEGGEVVFEDAPAAEPTRIVLRTVHDETSLWLPRLVAIGGQASIHARLPESITEEEISVLATDRTGGIALARVHVPVAQALFARSDLPPSITDGETLEVNVAAENHHDEAIEIEVGLEALAPIDTAHGALEIEGEPRRARVAPGGTITARYLVRASAPGTARYRVHASGGSLEDVDEREITVEASGAPVVEASEGMVSGQGVYRTTLSLDPGDRAREVRLGVVFPTIAPALSSVASLFSMDPWGPDPAASQVMGAAAAYRYLVLTEQYDPAVHGETVTRLRAIGRQMSEAQNFDGGFGWYWSNGRSTPFVTTHALEALLELRDVALLDDETPIRRAAAYLVSTLRENGPFAAEDVAPWEGHDPWVSTAASLEALHAIARALPSDDPLRIIVRDELFAPRLAEVMASSSPDPLALAHAVSAGMWLEALDREQLEELVPRLADVRAITHWEPGWFDAWGGNVEAAATTLEVLDVLRADEHDGARGLVTEARFEGAARDAIRFILHTRGSFGAWHNTRATAWAIRALTRVAPGDPDEHGTVHVLVDGEEHDSIEVSADTLFASALALREIDLSSLAAGEHEVEVRYDGRSRPRVELEVRRWGGAAPSTPEPSAPLPREAREQCEVGGACAVSVTLPAELHFPARIEQPLGDGFEVDRAALEELASSGVVAWHDLAGGTLRLAVSTRVAEITLPLRTTRPGQLVLAPTRASQLAGGATHRSDASPITSR